MLEVQDSNIGLKLFKEPQTGESKRYITAIWRLIAGLSQMYPSCIGIDLEIGLMGCLKRNQM